MAILNDVLDTGSQLTANATVKPNGILLSVGDRMVAILENKEGKPQIVVYADAQRDEPTHIIPLRQHDRE